MIDLSNLPESSNITKFVGTQPATATGGFVRWAKPRGAVTVAMFAIGSGGGGGGGFAAAVGSTKGGGGGGRSAAFSFALFLASSLPDTLLVFVTAGGTGGGSGANGTAGTVSRICGHTPTALQNNFLTSSSAGATFGGAGTAAAGGAGGANSTLASVANCPLVNFAVSVSFNSGQVGTKGNILTPLNTSVGTLAPVLGGAGGGGYTAAGSPSAGGGVVWSGYFQDMPGGTAGGVVGGRGTDGLWVPPYIFGGTGGGGTNDAVSTGGAGGHGIAPGAGGGGGGAGVTGGRGGDGGPGMVVIVSYP